MSLKIPFIFEFDFEYRKAQTLTPLIRRVIADNPSPFTFKGTGTENNLSYDADLRLVFDRSKYDVRYRSASLFSDLGDRIIADDVKLTVKAKFKWDSNI